MFGLEPFKAFASTPIENVIIAMIPQMNMNAFVQFQIVEPKNRLIVFSIFSNDSNIEIVSKKKQICKLAISLILSVLAKKNRPRLPDSFAKLYKVYNCNGWLNTPWVKNCIGGSFDPCRLKTG